MINENIENLVKDDLKKSPRFRGYNLDGFSSLKGKSVLHLKPLSNYDSIPKEGEAIILLNENPSFANIIIINELIGIDGIGNLMITAKTVSTLKGVS